MCGIAGYVGYRDLSDSQISRLSSLMSNRGPDNFDYLKFKFKKNFFYLFHSRLSIIDLKKRSNQPFIYKNINLIFNGEIYNFKEIKNDLKSRGYKFKTLSDTEVLAKSYMEYGERCVEKFEGMWSFAIWDNNKKKLFISRDRFGEKPLFYSNKDNFIFGSQTSFLKILNNENLVNETQVKNFLFNGYKNIFTHKNTFYKNIKKLDPAHNITILNNFEKKIKCYWKPSFNPIKNLKENDVAEEVEFLLKKSLKIRLRADVPLAVSLSGGVDSAIITALAKTYHNKHIKTYSIVDYDKRYNEYENIKKNVNFIGVKNKLLILNKKNYTSELNKIISYSDSPVATISNFINFLLIDQVKKDGCKVILSGSGADEIFSGYYHHFLLYLNQIKDEDIKLYNSSIVDWKKNIFPILRNDKLKDLKLKNLKTDFEDKKRIEKYIKFNANSNTSSKFYNNDKLRNYMFNETFKKTLPVALHHEDLNSMYHSIENRSPFLDKKLFEFMCRVPTKFLIKDGFQKNILRNISKNMIPDKVRLQKQKYGFNASINSILDLKNDKTKSFLLDKKSMIWNFVKINSIKNLISKNKIDNLDSKFLFAFINTKIFLDKNS
tara:strand:+ start:796 stop:2607 length:1812 start_codon:yes stop_codon:yes gene_type:complete